MMVAPSRQGQGEGDGDDGVMFQEAEGEVVGVAGRVVEDPFPPIFRIFCSMMMMLTVWCGWGGYGVMGLYGATGLGLETTFRVRFVITSVIWMWPRSNARLWFHMETWCGY